MSRRNLSVDAFRARDEELNKCPAPTRIQRFLPEIKALDNLSFAERVKRYHLPFGVSIPSA
eukprot:6616109-Pyramimonas_sp.AAC.1